MFILEFSESILLSNRIKIKKKDSTPLFPSLENSRSKDLTLDSTIPLDGLFWV